MKWFVVSLKHDSGTASFRIYASSEEVAINSVCETEGAPRSAVQSCLPLMS